MLKVAPGRYDSASEVVRAALHLLDDPMRRIDRQTPRAVDAHRSR